MDKAKVHAAAEKFVVKGQYDKALEQFTQLLKADPFDTKALNRVAEIHLKKGDNSKGIEFLTKLADSYTRDGFYSKAVAIYKRVLKIDESQPKEQLVETYEKLSDLYGQLGLISDAMAHYSIVVDVYDRQQNHEALLNVLRKVSDLDPYNIDSQLKLAELFIGQGREQEGRESLLRLVENVTAKGHMPDILRVYEQWVDLFPADLDRLKDLVERYIQVGEPKKALSKIQVAFKSNPREPQVLELLAMTFQSLKQPEKAKAVEVELIKIYRQAGDEDKAQFIEARLKGQVPVFDTPPPRGSEGKASSAAASPDALDPSESLIQNLQMDPDERKLLSECDVYLKYGLNDKAQEALTAALGKFSQSIAIRWKLKQVCLDKGLTEHAAHILSEVVLLAKSKNLKPWQDLAEEQLAELDSSHPSLAGRKKSKPDVAPSSMMTEANIKGQVSDTTQVESIDFNDFGESEISIVLEEDVSLEPLVELENTVDPKSMVAPIPSEDEPEAQEVEEDSAASGGEPLLTEADFSAEELARLNRSLVPEESGPIELEAPPSLDEVSMSGSQSNPIELEISLDEPSQTKEHAPIAAVAEQPIVDSDFEIRQGLEEIEFFTQQGLQGEADQVIKSLNTKFPGNPLLQKFITSTGKPAASDKLRRKIQEVEALGRKVKVSVQEDDRGMDEDSFFDLAKELDDEMKTEKAPFGGPTEVRDVFSAFKAGVAQVVSSDDWQTHFDLGIAYREMGLMDDAISEFKLVSKVKGRAASALYQIGACEVSRGNLKAAKDSFDLALKEPDLVSQERMSIAYDLADVLIQLNDRDRAKKLLEEVKKLDPEFREIQDKLNALA